MRMMKGCICALPVDVEYLLRRQKIQIVVYEAVGYRIHVEDVLLRHAIESNQRKKMGFRA